MATANTGNALDRMWEHLDELTDRLLDGADGDGYDKIRAGTAAWCVSQFYGADLDWVREEAMKRRARREADS